MLGREEETDNAAMLKCPGLWLFCGLILVNLNPLLAKVMRNLLATNIQRKRVGQTIYHPICPLPGSAIIKHCSRQ